MRMRRPKGWTPARVWSQLGIDRRILFLMLKGGLPPTIAIAISQSNAIANITENYGFYVAISAVISPCVMPRAKFMKLMFFTVLGICIAAALSCLGVFCAVRARQHTTALDASKEVREGYNSSACAVAALWFVFDIWISNTLRHFRPTELVYPVIAFSMYTSVAMTQAPRFVTLDAGFTFLRQILLCFLLGFAIATCVSLLVFPMTSRRNFVDGMKPYPATVKTLLDAQIAYVRRSQAEGPWKITRRATRTRRNTLGSVVSRQHTRGGGDDKKKPPLSPLEEKAKELNDTMNKLNSMHSQLHTDLYYAKQELAWGRFSSEDLDHIYGLLRAILIPLSGIGMLPDIFAKISKPLEPGHLYSPEGFAGLDTPEESDVADEPAQEHFVGHLSQRLQAAAELVNLGLQHTFIGLDVVSAKDFAKQHAKEQGKGPRKISIPFKDEEASGDSRAPGNENFTASFETRMTEFYIGRKELPERWASLNLFAPSIFDYDYEPEIENREVRKEFFVILFLGHLQDALLQATLDLVRFADSKVADGTMSQRRFIFPKKESLEQWFSFTEADEDKTERPTAPNRREGAVSEVLIDKEDPLKTRYPDPEHMPPTNNWERFGNMVRLIPHFLSSEQSVFGFRVAVASLSIGILAFLAPTQDFYIKQRVGWAVIILIIGMNPTSGNSVFGLMGRVVGTSLSVILSFVVWYIVAGKTAGVIIFLYLGNCLQYYFFVRFPRFTPACTIAITTFNLIISYALQVRKLGIERSTASGTTYYPLYLFAPYRLATVIAGCAVSFIWIVFPYPTSSSSQVRRLLSRSLFILANFYSCMHTTIEVWINQEQGSLDDDQSPAHLLERARNQLYVEQISILARLREQSEFTRYEPAIGGRFPRETYDAIAAEIRMILTSMDLMAHLTKNLENMSVDKEQTENITNDNRSSINQHLGTHKLHRSASTGSNPEKWIAHLARAANTPEFHSHIVTSVLCQLSGAVANGVSLPPYLAPPHPFPLARRLRRLNEGLLDMKHIEDPSFSAFVSVEVLSSMVSSGLKGLVGNVKRLVGELNFDVYVRPHRRRRAQASRQVSMDTSRNNSALFSRPSTAMS
ncbi:hypothetical protein AJ80_06010 [Polytolypa hystricis UAMH7299]|uniref:ER transporter 6TM N-terminal domain-containing protein n=1 Tax=Polytolypa hystricis (strain UAMH7299) TaxID=1447883 RepID=A0A2B7XZ22_POLH7|nr:hypothetical protein AJ80_06010 [Polytolypa hystricis UAMH7299]